MIGMNDHEATTIARLALRGAGCCTVCVGEFFLALVDEQPDVAWLDIVAESDPDSEVLDYVHDPAGFEP